MIKMIVERYREDWIHQHATATPLPDFDWAAAINDCFAIGTRALGGERVRVKIASDEGVERLVEIMQDDTMKGCMWTLAIGN